MLLAPAVATIFQGVFCSRITQGVTINTKTIVTLDRQKWGGAVYRVVAIKFMILDLYRSFPSTPDYILKTILHSSRKIEQFVETHICKLCVILRSRVLRVVCPYQGYRSATPLATTV